MVEIKKAAIEQFIGPIAEDQFNVKVSLFVVSTKNQRLKKIDLDNLPLEKRAEKLHQWAQEHRYVAVIEAGDMIFAHTHMKYAEQLQKVEDLSLDGKKITVKALTDEDAERLSAVGEAFEEHVLNVGEVKIEEEEEKKAKKETSSESHRNHLLASQYLAPSMLMGDQLQMHFLVDQMVKNKLGNIITDCMQQYSEARRQLKKEKDEEDRHADIIRTEIQKGELKRDITKGEIAKKEQQGQIVAENADRVNRTRGIEE